MATAQIPAIAATSMLSISGGVVIKRVPTASPITPATKDTSGRILLINITLRFESVPIIAHAKRHKPDSADIMQAIVVNARDTIILLHAGRASGVS